MDRNGAREDEEWRKRSPPLWVHSTDLLTVAEPANANQACVPAGNLHKECWHVTGRSAPRDAPCLIPGCLRANAQLPRANACAPTRPRWTAPPNKVSRLRAKVFIPKDISERCQLTSTMSGRQRRTPVRRMAKTVPAVGGPLDQHVKHHSALQVEMDEPW